MTSTFKRIRDQLEPWVPGVMRTTIANAVGLVLDDQQEQITKLKTRLDRLEVRFNAKEQISK